MVRSFTVLAALAAVAFGLTAGYLVSSYVESSAGTRANIVLVALLAGLGVVALVALVRLVSPQLSSGFGDPRRLLAPFLQSAAAFGTALDAQAGRVRLPSFGGTRLDPGRLIGGLADAAGRLAAALTGSARLLAQVMRHVARRVRSFTVLAALAAVAFGLTAGYLVSSYVESSAGTRANIVLVALLAGLGVVALVALVRLVSPQLSSGFGDPRRLLAPFLQSAAAFGTALDAQAGRVRLPSFGGTRLDPGRLIGGLADAAGRLAAALTGSARLLAQVMRHVARRTWIVVWSFAALAVLVAAGFGAIVTYLVSRYVE